MTSLARAQAIYRDAIASPINPFIVKSFRTLNKHRDSGAFDSYSALRLLRNNLRDIPGALALSITEKDYIARRLLQFWRLQWHDK